MARLGRGLAIGIGEETVWGTAVARTHWFRGVSESMKRTISKRPLPFLAEATGSRNRKRHYLESDKAGGTFEILVGLEGLGLLLKHALHGTPSTTGTDPYTHVFKLGANPPTGGLTIEVVRGTGTAMIFEGCRIQKMVFKVEAGGVFRCTVDIIAQTATRAAAGTPAYTTNEVDVVHHHGGTVAWNALTLTAKAIEFTIDNHFAERMLIGDLTTKDPAPEFVDVTCKLDSEWEADAVFDGFTADTESDLAITFTVGSRSIALELHNAFVEDYSDPISGPGVVAQSATFRGQSDGTDEGIEITVVNSQASATAA